MPLAAYCNNGMAGDCIVDKKRRMTPLDVAVEKAGSRLALARHLDVGTNMPWRWSQAGGLIPPRYNDLLLSLGMTADEIVRGRE